MLIEKFAQSSKRLKILHGCLENLLSLFMSLLAALVVQNSHILAEIYFIFLKDVLNQT